MNRRDLKSPIRSVFSDAKLCGYNALLILLSPYILWRKSRRARSRKTPHEFDWTRWSCAAQPEYSSVGGAHVVLFCTGVGELRIAEKLTELLHAQNQTLNVTWAIRRSDVAELARLQHPRQSIVGMPFDFFWPCCNWFRAVQPDILVGIERLWWPNLFWHSRLNNIPSIVVGATSLARIKHKSWDKISRWTLRALDEICLQSEDERKKIAPFLPPENVRVTGALKWFESKSFEDKLHQIEEQENPNSLAAWLKNTPPLLLAGSTHEGEEAFVLRAFKALREKTNCALIIAPRQLHRAEKIEKLCVDAGWKVAQRSAPRAEYSAAEIPDVYLLDTMGELSSAYQFARAAFVGGTIRGAGHNVLEPLAFGVPVAFGIGGEKSQPTPTQKELLDFSLGFRVSSAEELATHWLEILENENAQSHMSERLETFRENQITAWNQSVAAILELIAKSQISK